VETRETYFRRGFGLKKVILPVLEAEYHSRIVDRIRAAGFRLTVDGLTLRLAEQFGFCYGVDRAVEYAYETRHKFPDRRIFLVGEIIHNPHVNNRMRSMGIRFLLPRNGEFDFSEVRPDDVVILPAFGVTIQDFQRIRALGCTVVDTTCGSVLNVWKRVESYARDGFTAVVHGKVHHEETRATASQVLKYPQGRYLVVRDLAEARAVCDYIRHGGDREAFLRRFGRACSPGFDPDRDLQRIGVANQTTMLASETARIAEEFRTAMLARYGEADLPNRYRHYDTLCSATQDRQDAVIRMMQDPPDVMVVIGGYNSSNTNHLAHICAERTRTYHIEDAHCIDPETGRIEYKPVGATELRSETGWLPPGPVTVGLTAGASTPNNKIGETVERICLTRGTDPRRLLDD
jgi:4-hydroxy-3-methylbut-2-enyl diphosphate reductase